MTSHGKSLVFQKDNIIPVFVIHLEEKSYDFKGWFPLWVNLS